MTFKLDERLESSSHLVVTHKYIQIRLADDTRYFWLILVPTISRNPNSTFVSEIHELPSPLATDLWLLASQIGKWLQAHTGAEKINIAALGNVVSQLHLHVVSRHRSDAAWPAPIWGLGAMEPLETSERDRRLASLQDWYKKASGTM